MLDKPDECCACGSYEHTIPMPLNGRVTGIDLCISRIVAALNAANIKTEASCCGHGKIAPTIILEDDTWIVLMSRDEAEKYFKQQEPK